MLLAVRISSYGCTWKVWRALKKLELHCSPNFPRASITRYMHAKHEQILNYFILARPSIIVGTPSIFDPPFVLKPLDLYCMSFYKITKIVRAL